jgi:hypothetical protein
MASMSHANYSPEETSSLEEQVKTQVKDKSNWLRLFFMLIFAVIFYAVFFVTCAVALIQFFARLLSGKPLSSLADFNTTLADYSRDLVAYLTYISDRKPFPFKE